MWVYGQTRLVDYYAGRMSLRELLNRLQSLPDEAPIWRAVEEQQERAAGRQKVADVEATLAMVKPN